MEANKWKQAVAPGFWGAVAGAVAVCVIGFNWGGWVTGGTAAEMAQAAVVDRLVPICVDQFNEDSQKAKKLAEMKQAQTWMYGDYVAKQGWATIPGAQDANSDVAELCATKILS